VTEHAARRFGIQPYELAAAQKKAGVLAPGALIITGSSPFITRVQGSNPIVIERINLDARMRGERNGRSFRYHARLL